MTPVEILSHLRSLDIRLRVEDEKLRVNAPKGALTPQLRAELESHKAELVAYLRSVEAAALFQTQPLRPIPRQIHHVLSFAQQRLWLLDQMEPESPVYNISGGTSLAGPLKIAALEQALNEIIRRHEVLRTTFGESDEQPVQNIARAMRVEVPLVDLGSLTREQRELEIQRVAVEEAQKPFNLTVGPLLRTVLLRLGDDNHVLLYTMHHIVSDAWSIGIFMRELTTLYGAYSAGKPSPLSELPIQYADFAHWQREWLQGEVLNSQLAYWKRQLAGALQVLELPTDRPRPRVQTFVGAVATLDLPKELSYELRGLARSEGVTLFMLLLAAFQTLLYRYSHQEDVVVGSPIANRNRVEIEPLIGFFVNTLVLRTDLSGNPTFRELLARVREVALGAYSHQDLPFEKLVEELRPERSLSHSPLFQVAFSMENAPGSPLESAGLTLTPLELEWKTSKFDLTLFMHESPTALRGVLEYNTDLFDGSTMGRMLSHFQSLLENLVADPGQRISQPSLLNDAEWQKVVVEWNQTASEYPRDKCIHQLVEAQVERTPDAVAVVYGESGLTYRELNTKANQLAHHLRGLGVGPDIAVVLFMERSVEMVISLLAILKAGGAYVPLDTTYPPERIKVMLEDAKGRVLITDRPVTAELLSHPIQILRLDKDWDTIGQEPIENPVNQTNGESLAYVIYTSGSTGKPKGTCIPHCAINRLLSNTNYIEIQSSDNVAQASNASFDAATFEIWGALLSGARLVGIPRDVILSPQAFAKALHDQNISIMFLTTALFNQMAREAPGAFARLRCLLFGGEAVDPRWVREVLHTHPPQRLLHVYGPTETTTFATWHLVNGVEPDAVTIPIGRPISNTEAYILDPNLQPVPIGLSGELHLGGDGLARGYLNRPDLTAEKFIPHPFNQVHGARLYKTGDLCRFLEDGSIEFLGRIDTQVKIRGFRVELEEIESVLDQHPGVQECVVVMREDTPGDKRLVAYLVPRNQGKPVVSELRSLLKQKLPDYMVPGTFVILDSLPLSPNGKVDRRALPIPDASRPDLEEKYIAPRNPVEEVLVGILGEVLGLERVGIHDNFFELGGHSLMATRAVGRIRDAFELELPLRRLFEAPTAAELADLLLQDTSVRGNIEKRAQVLLRLAELSAEETHAMLKEKSSATGKGGIQ
ncbi:MAG: amino acid adenylation domain-containing protein [Acidobacteriia bacterium]|nr:amino acid adenylation domain-containing protein [Terriglobia bacterium]